MTILAEDLAAADHSTRVTQENREMRADAKSGKLAGALAILAAQQLELQFDDEKSVTGVKALLRQ